MDNVIGTTVVNFGYVAVVVEVKPDGSLVLENPRIGKWIADPENCELYIPG